LGLLIRQILEEQRKSCKASPLTSPAQALTATSATRLTQQPRTQQATNKTAKDTRQQVNPCRLSPYGFPLSSTRAARLRLIARDYRNPKRHKKILDTKALDKVYIYYQSAMTTT
jgi:hypothetical protein